MEFFNHNVLLKHLKTCCLNQGVWAIFSKYNFQCPEWPKQTKQP